MQPRTPRNLRIIPAYAGSTPAPPGPATYWPDHPRIRGEHFTIEWEVRPGRGSSPHTRGARPRGLHCRHTVGIIPAYAGSTRRHPPDEFLAGDHPRIRGEHLYFDKPQTRNCGSSPHTRGAPHGSSWTWPGVRIIPAYAGSTSRRCRDFYHIPDHPRIRGEHDEDAVVVDEARGSSPHTRGALGTG